MVINGIEIDTYCGLSCKDCEFAEACNCGGCIATGGNPFHGKCDVAKCANEKGRRFCGECADFPCDLLKSYSFDAEHGDNGARIQNCSRIKTALVEQARKGLDPISPCGFHCDCCFMGEGCGGCRSDYNCCSYATMFEDSLCPNVTCSREKGLDGCYECDELSACELGFYSIKDDHLAKGTALFIKKHGKDEYDHAIRLAKEKKLNFDMAENALAICKMLEDI